MQTEEACSFLKCESLWEKPRGPSKVPGASVLSRLTSGKVMSSLSAAGGPTKPSDYGSGKARMEGGEKHRRVLASSPFMREGERERHTHKAGSCRVQTLPTRILNTGHRPVGSWWHVSANSMPAPCLSTKMPRVPFVQGA